MTQIESKNKGIFSWFNIYTWYWPTNEQVCKSAEEKLLKRAFHNLEENEKVKVERVKISKGEINTLVIKNNEKNTKNLVITHGFGVGLGIYFKNYNEIATHNTDWNIYSIDWLGMGRSSRPLFKTTKSKNQTDEEYIIQSEDFFVESFEEWRGELKIDKIVLLGHSLGGYLSAVYAMKYPERVEKLILASPVGIPSNPNHDNIRKDKIIKTSKSLKMIDQPLNSHDSDNLEPKSELGNINFKIPRWITYLWDKKYSPQYLVRFLGPYGKKPPLIYIGPTLVGKYVFRRFAHLELEEQHELKDYLFHISSMKGSGEYAIGALLAPGAFARNPLINRLPDGIKCPTTFIYGYKDWMDYRCAMKLRKLMDIDVAVVRVPEAGHQLFIENPAFFNQIVTDILKNKFLNVGEK